MSTTLIILSILFALSLLYIISIFNRLVALKNRFLNSFAQIDVQLKRRHDLIPSMVEVAKAYMKFEKETLDSVISARNQAVAGLNAAIKDPSNPDAINQLASAESLLTGALGKMNVVVEDYPELKSNENMLRLMEELSSTENRISFARQAYNDSVTAYNQYKQSFPPLLFVSIFGHKVDARLLEFEDEQQIQYAPEVSF